MRLSLAIRRGGDNPLLIFHTAPEHLDDDALGQIIEWRGKLMGIRVDNGPEYVSGKLQVWAQKRGIGLFYIQPGKPQQNAYVERYNRTVRQEWLGQYIWNTIEEVKDHATRWLWTYNNERPNMGIGGITPAMKMKLAA